jgi:hypothetical protein
MWPAKIFIECFSNTLHVGADSTSVPLDEFQVAVAQVESHGEESVVQSAAAIVMANKATANDAVADKHLPDSPEKDDAKHSDHGKNAEDKGQQDEQQEAGQQIDPLESYLRLLLKIQHLMLDESKWHYIRLKHYLDIRLLWQGIEMTH